MNNSNQGFTLLELLTVLAIAGIIFSIAVPSMSGFIKKSRMTAYANELVSSIQIARSEAIKLSTFACVCPTADASVAVPVCNASSSWESGWIAFTDSAGNCSFEPGDTTPDVLLKAVTNEGFENFTVRNNDASINTSNYVRFTSRGAPQQISGVAQMGMFTVCDDRGYILASNGDTVPRGVILSAAGSLRSTRSSTQLTACP